MLKRSCVLVVGVLSGCWGDSSATSDLPVANRPTEDFVFARLNDTTVSSDAPANLKVEFSSSGEPQVTFELNITNAPAISVFGLTGYDFLETGAAEVAVTQSIRRGGASLFLAGELQTSGRLELELSGHGKVTGTLLDADDRLTFAADVQFSCAVPSRLLPEATPAPVSTNPAAPESLVYDTNFASAECRGARDLTRP